MASKKIKDLILKYTIWDYIVAMGIELDDCQLDTLVEFFKDEMNIVQYLKSRQVGISYLAMLYLIIMAQLRGDLYGVVLSYKQADSKEKIQEIRKLYDLIPEHMKHKLINDNTLELRFSNGALIKCTSARQFRGFPSKNFVVVVLDEFAFWMGDQKALEAIEGGLVHCKYGSAEIIISTPFGTNNAYFRKWHTDDQGTTKRFKIAWWNSHFLVREGIDETTGKTYFELAQEQAPLMSTRERVRRFGNKVIKRQYLSMFIESFKQEYECDFSANSNNLISLEEVKKVLEEGLIVDDYELENKVYECMREGWKINCGVDISTGTSTDLSCISIIATRTDDGIKRHKLIYYKSMKVSLSDIEDEIRYLYKRGIIGTATIDERGVGFSVWQNLNHEFGVNMRRFNSTQSKNTYTAYMLREVIRKKLIRLENDIELIKDLCSIVVEKNNGNEKILFKRDRQRGHNDIASSLFLALYDERFDNFSFSDINNA